MLNDKTLYQRGGDRVGLGVPGGHVGPEVREIGAMCQARVRRFGRADQKCGRYILLAQVMTVGLARFESVTASRCLVLCIYD